MVAAVVLDSSEWAEVASGDGFPVDKRCMCGQKVILWLDKERSLYHRLLEEDEEWLSGHPQLEIFAKAQAEKPGERLGSGTAGKHWTGQTKLGFLCTRTLKVVLKVMGIPSPDACFSLCVNTLGNQPKQRMWAGTTYPSWTRAALLCCKSSLELLYKVVLFSVH